MQHRLAQVIRSKEASPLNVEHVSLSQRGVLQMFPKVCNTVVERLLEKMRPRTHTEIHYSERLLGVLTNCDLILRESKRSLS